jgi:hypothetical protein
VKLFKPYSDSADKPATPEAAVASGQTETTGTANGAKAPTKKTIPTPKRRDAEQARRDRIQPVLTRKEARTREREARFEARDAAMTKAHARPYNVMTRDWVDRRWNLAEFALPVLVLLFILTLVGSYLLPSLMLYSPYVIWVAFLVVVADTVVMWIGLRRQLKLHFPDEPLKGKFNYAFSRTMLMRRSRIPAPRVKRGDKFVWPPQGGLS